MAQVNIGVKVCLMQCLNILRLYHEYVFLSFQQGIRQCLYLLFLASIILLIIYSELILVPILINICTCLLNIVTQRFLFYFFFQLHFC